MQDKWDVIVVGAGHNGLVASILLAKHGLRTLVLEAQETIGGAVRTEYPFKKAPNLGTSTGAYLLGLMPPELFENLGIKLPLLRRDPHYFLPTTDGRYLLFGADEQEMQRQFTRFFSPQDWAAHLALQQEITHLRDDLGQTWLQNPLSIEETAERFVRDSLKDVFVALCRGSVGDYLSRFEFKSDLLKAMYAVTDGFSGLNGTWNTPGTGMNFLIHNMCRLPGSDGTWMIVRGGMGTVTQTLANRARELGVSIQTNSRVSQLDIQSGQVQGVVLENGTRLRSDQVLFNADPFQMRKVIGEEQFPADYNARLDNYRLAGSTLKVNLCLRDLPEFHCLPENRGQHSSTIHLLPDEDVVLDSLLRSHDDVQHGRLPEFPTIEWYIHTTVDPSLQDEKGRHNSALFVQWVPYEIAGSTWEDAEAGYVSHLLSICDRFAPGTSALVEDTFVLHPQKIESYFGMTYGHIHHIDNSFGFADRLPYETPIAGVYSCSAGCHPGGSVIGASGHNAAMSIIEQHRG